MIKHRTGYLAWKYYNNNNNVCLGSPIVINEQIYLVANNGEISVLEQKKGKLIKKIPPEEPLAVPAILYEKYLILATHSGKIITWDEETKKYHHLFHVNVTLRFPMILDKNEIFYVEGTKTIRKFSFEKEEINKTESVEDNKEEQEKSEETSEETPEDNEEKGKDNKKTEKEADKKKRPEKKSRQDVKLNDDDGSTMWIKLALYTVPFIGLLVLFLSNALEGKTILYFAVLFTILISFFLVNDYLQTENYKLRTMMHKFVPTGLMQKLGSDKKTAEKEVTVLFQDLYNYTSISEKLTTEELYSLLDAVDKITNDIVTKYGGEIMSYVGDAQMIVFNAAQDLEHHAIQAVKTAIEINAKVKELGESLEKDKNKKFPFKLQMGFGINTGKALIGVRGGSNKMEPFVIGDTTNTAVRLQKLTRQLDRRMLVTSSTASKVGNFFKLGDMGLFELKGKKVPTRVYAILDI
jgi:class 3 adenylate cyclase